MPLARANLTCLLTLCYNAASIVVWYWKKWGCPTFLSIGVGSASPELLPEVRAKAGLARMVGRREMTLAAVKAVWFLTKPLLDEVREDKAVVT